MQSATQGTKASRISVASEGSYTLNEVAGRLGVSRRTVERLVADGMLRVFRPRPKGRLVRVSAAEFDNYLRRVAA